MATNNWRTFTQNSLKVYKCLMVWHLTPGANFTILWCLCCVFALVHSYAFTSLLLNGPNDEPKILRRHVTATFVTMLTMTIATTTATTTIHLKTHWPSISIRWWCSNTNTKSRTNDSNDQMGDVVMSVHSNKKDVLLLFVFVVLYF